MCLAAVLVDAFALEFVPNSLKTLENCRIDVRKNASMFLYVPESLRTKEICLYVVSRNGMLFTSI